MRGDEKAKAYREKEVELTCRCHLLTAIDVTSGEYTEC